MSKSESLASLKASTARYKAHNDQFEKTLKEQEKTRQQRINQREALLVSKQLTKG